MRLFYIAYIRAKLDYGSILYASAAATQLKKLDVLQNSCMRMILGDRKSTHVQSHEYSWNLMFNHWPFAEIS